MPKTKQYSKEEIVNKLQSLEKKYGDTTIETINKCEDMPSHSTIARYFDNGMTEAREKANVDIRPYKQTDTFHRLVDDVIEMERGGTLVTSSTIDRSTQYKIEVANSSLTEIRNCANLIRDYTDTKQMDKFDMIEQLSSIDSEVVKLTDVTEKTDYSPADYSYQFNSFTHALKLAGKTNGRHNSSFWKRLTGHNSVSDALESIDGYNSSASYYVYRLKFDNTVFYVGATSDLTRRMSEKQYWPKDKPIDIYVESFNDKKKCNKRETELTFETAIEFDTNDVYGGHKKY